MKLVYKLFFVSAVILSAERGLTQDMAEAVKQLEFELGSDLHVNDRDNNSQKGAAIRGGTDNLNGANRTDSEVGTDPSAPAGMGSTFYRPSVSVVYSRIGTRSEDVLFSGLQQQKLPSRFDEYKLNNCIIQYQHPTKPELPEDLDVMTLKKAIKEYNVKLKQYNEDIDRLNKNNLVVVARDIVAQTLRRDANGNFSFSGIIERATNSATDSDVNISSRSTNKEGAYLDIADSLLNRLYIMVYEITNAKTYQEHYNQIDATRRRSSAASGKEFKPVERTQEGWFVDYETYIYRVNWNDSVAAVFYSEMWLEQSVQDNRSSRAQAFDNFNLPLRRTYARASVATISQSNDPEFYAKPFAPRRKTMDELLTEVPKSIVDNSVFSASQEIDDFKLRAPITSAYGLKGKNLVKLGKKEGAYTDQRYFVYRQDLKKGQAVKKRIGVLRPVNIEDNTGLATGESVPSTFRQQGGKRLYNGDLVEMGEDIGLGVRLGLATGLSAGLGAGLEYRLSDLYKEKFMRGLYLTAEASLSSIGRGTFFNEEGFDAAVFGTDKLDISSMNLYVGICKEVYFTKRGNFHYLPAIGGGASLINVSSDVANGPSISNMVYFAYIEPMSVGYHFSPTVSLNCRVQFPVWVSTDNWVDDATEEALIIAPSLLVNNNNGVVVFNRESAASALVFGLRFKL